MSSTAVRGGAALAAFVDRWEKLSAGGFFLALSLLWFWPVLFGEQLTQDYTLFGAVPWAADAPPGLPSRAVFPDAALSTLPLIEVARDQLAAGHLPLWNPYEYGGQPLLGNMQSALLFPGTWPLLVLPLHTMWGFVVAGKLAVAGLGTYLFARALGLRRFGAFPAGAVYMLSAPLIAWAQWPLGWVYALFPWLLLASWAVLRGRGPRAVAGVGLAVGLTILAGHPETALISVSAAGIFVVGTVAADPALRGSRGARAAGRWLCGGALGLLVAAGALVPFLQALDGSVTGAEGADVAARLNLSPELSLQYAFPTLFGNGEPRVYGGAFYNSVAAHFGTPAFVLALVGLVLHRRRPAAIALAVMAGVTLLAAWGTPPVDWLRESVPPWSKLLITERANFVIALAGAVGAGGCLSLVSRKALPWRQIALAVGGSGAAAVLGFALFELLGTLAAPRSQKLIALALGLAGLAAAAVILACVGRIRKPVGLTVTLALLLLSLIGVRGLNVTLPRDRAYPREARALGFLRAASGASRVGVLRPRGREVMPPNTGATARIATVEGYDFPLSGTWSALQTDVLGFKGLRPESRRAVGTPSPAALAAYRMLGTRLFVAPPGARPPRSDLRVRYDGHDARVFEDPSALPRAFVVGAASQASPGQARARMATGRLDPRRVALVPRGVKELRGSSFRAASYEQLAPDRVRVRVPRGPSGWLVVSNAYHRGWRAEIDGRPASLRKTNLALMGLPVSGGSHTVELSLDRTPMLVGLLLSIIGLITCAVLFARRRV